MSAKLLVIAGPLEGVTFNLLKTPVSLGRELDNQICIADISVSRHHCAVHRESNALVLHDLGSRNATYVNGLPIKEHRLKTGDRLRLGDSVLLFLDEAEDLSDSQTKVQFNDTRLDTKNTVLLRRASTEPEDSLIEIAKSKPFLSSREAEELNALLKLSATIYAHRQSESLQQHVLQSLGAVIPAERGAIILIEESSSDAGSDGSEVAAVQGWLRKAEADAALQLSRTVIRQVLKEKAALLSNDIAVDHKLKTADSVALSHIRALIAAPLTMGEKTLGVIYLDAVTPGRKFDQDHLELLRAVASMTASALENLRRFNQLESENQRLKAEISGSHDMVGQAPKMRETYAFISKAAPTDATVLIRGESGTGKELAARALHNHSPRAEKPFVAINCAALTETLLESELFGYEKGAFTGANTQKKGKVEVAQGGTLFLDEIGEMAMNLQAKLLRVLQEREFERVGGTKPIKADIRVVAATNRALEDAIKEGRFREDLFYRLNVITLKLPPLRERREDIKLLANHFAAKYAQRCKRTIKGITPDALNCLLNYDWPGNVREFENTIERAVVLGSTDMLGVEDLPENLISAKPAALVVNQPTAEHAAQPAALGNFYDLINDAKKQLIIRAVEQAKGNYTEAAKLLDVHPNHLHRLIRNLDMKGELLKFHS
jgi:Nif-specific regulatory protein